MELAEGLAVELEDADEWVAVEDVSDVEMA